MVICNDVMIIRSSVTLPEWCGSQRIPVIRKSNGALRVETTLTHLTYVYLFLWD